IDAVCVNQTDLPERSQQVQLMTDVYSRAKEVVVWLGQADHNSAEFVKIVETLPKAPPLSVGLDNFMRDIPWLSLCESILNAHTGDVYGCYRKLRLPNVLSLTLAPTPYFSGPFVVQ
ncbi:hypothetical protein BAUCODRAFT_79562, partial [Baudoinia panamericana UAMH 10762]